MTPRAIPHALLLLLWFSATAALHAQPATIPTTKPISEFATFGVEFVPPHAMKRIPEGALTHIARWAKLDSSGRPTALVILELEKCGDRDTRRFAEGIATKLGGRVVESPLRIGGEETFAIREAKGAHWEALVARNANSFYVVSARADVAALVPRQEMETLAESIRFVPFADPATALTLRGEAFPILGAFTIEPLSAMRPNPGAPQPDTVGISVYDFGRDRVAMDMIMQVIPVNGDVPFEQLQQKLAEMGSPGDVRWSRLHIGGEAVISNIFTAKRPDVADKVSLALARLDSTRVLLINFTFPSATTEQLPAYHDAANRVSQTIRPISKP